MAFVYAVCMQALFAEWNNIKCCVAFHSMLIVYELCVFYCYYYCSLLFRVCFSSIFTTSHSHPATILLLLLLSCSIYFCLSSFVAIFNQPTSIQQLNVLNGNDFFANVQFQMVGRRFYHDSISYILCIWFAVREFICIYILPNETKQKQQSECRLRLTIAPFFLISSKHISMFAYMNKRTNSIFLFCCAIFRHNFTSKLMKMVRERQKERKK